MSNNETEPLVPDCLLMRHGKTRANKEGSFQDADDPLLPEAEQQIVSVIKQLGSLMSKGIVRLERPLIVHHSPMPRAKISCDIALGALSDELGIQPKAVEERKELAERLTTPDIKNKGYDEYYIDIEGRHETWFQIYRKLEKYVTVLEESAENHHLFIIGHGGTNGMLKMMLEHGVAVTLNLLRADSIHAPDPLNPKSSEWYVNKIPNAAIDLYRKDAYKWRPLLQIRPEEELS